MVKKPEMLFAPAVTSVPDAVIDRVSVPVPPVKLSPAFNVLTAAVAVSLRMVELKVSLAVPPVKDAPVSRPVVSVLNWFPKKFNKHRHLACSHGLVFCVPPPFSDQNASKQAVER